MPAQAPSILDILANTPLWVWAVFLLLLTLGLQRIRDRSVTLWRLLLLPAAMALLGLSGLVGAGVAAVPAILVGFAAGGVGGWLMERDGATRRLPDGKVWVRGEWWSFVQILAVFAFRYVITVVSMVNPALHANPTWHLATMFVSATLTALFIGRVAARLRVYFRSTPIAA